MDDIMMEHPAPEYRLPPGTRYGTRKDAVGTSLSGYVHATLAELETIFGPPMRGSGDGKVDYQWVLHIHSQLCTVYNYKWRVHDAEQKYWWHIGGPDTVPPVAAVADVTLLPTEIAGHVAGVPDAVQQMLYQQMRNRNPEGGQPR